MVLDKSKLDRVEKEILDCGKAGACFIEFTNFENKIGRAHV